MGKFLFTINGEGVSPTTLPLEELLDTLADLHKAILRTALDAGHGRDEISLSLSFVDDGSYEATLSETDAAHAGTSRIIAAIKTQDFSAIPEDALACIESLARRSRAKNRTLTIENGEVAVIDGTTIIPKPVVVRGNTTLYPIVKRVGGIGDQTALLQFPTGSRTFPVATEELAARMAGRLHQRQALHGEAKWDAATMKLLDFRVTEMRDAYREDTSPAEVMGRLSDLADGCFDSIDPIQFVQGELDE